MTDAPPIDLRERLAEERRRDILDGARRVYVRRGFAGTTMADIAAEVGLTAGALYRYFPGGKDELVEALFAVCEEERVALFSSAASAAESPYARIVALGEAAWSRLTEPGGREQFAMQLENLLAGFRHELALEERPASSTRDSIDLMAMQITEAQRGGELSDSVDARALALTLFAAYAGCGQLAVQLDGEVDVRSVLDTLTTLVSTTLVRPADGASPEDAPQASERN